MTAIAPGLPVGSATSREARRLSGLLTRDVAWVAIVAGVAVALATGDIAAGSVQVAAAASLVLFGARAEVQKLSAISRVVLLALCAAFALGTSGDPPVMLARFLASVAAVALLQPKRAREHGLLLAVTLLEVALAALLTSDPLAVVFGALFAAAVHKALATFHRMRVAGRVEARRGTAAAPLSDRAASFASLRAAAAVLALAVPFFFVLPRIDRPLLALGPDGALTLEAVSESMRLAGSPSLVDGDEVLGQAAPRNDVAKAREPYFRVTAYEDFDGREWSVSREEAVERPASLDLDTGRADLDAVAVPADALAVYEIAFSAAAAPRLLVPEGVVSLVFRPPFPWRVHVDGAGGIRPSMGASTPRFTYAAEAGPLETHAGFRSLHDEPRSEGLLGVPGALERGLRPLVEEAVGNVVSARDRAETLEAFVRARCRYSLTVAPPAGSEDPVLDFLTRTRSGHCEYFAAALAACLRVAGVPARVVGGFHPSLWNDLGGGFWVVRRRDAHAWVEAWVEGEGGRSSWARFDATPPGAAGADPYAGVLGFLARLKDLIAFEWNRVVIGFDRDAQHRAVARSLETIGVVARSLASGVGAVLSGVALLAGAVWLQKRRTRRGARSRSSVAFYDAVLALLARRRLVKRPFETAEEFSRRAGSTLPREAADAVGEATRAFETTKYGGRPVALDGAPARWNEVLARRRPTSPPVPGPAAGMDAPPGLP